jgi:ankyrin repeat protein
VSDPITAGVAAQAPLPPPERLQELLFDAARLGRDDMIPALLQAGAQIEGQDERGFSPLVLASYNGQESTTALLLSLGAIPDGLPEDAGSSALMGVAFKGYVAIGRMLLDAGADPDRANRAGQTALMMASLFDQREIIAMLIAAGADMSRRDGSGKTAADIAEAQGNAELATTLQQTSAA